MRVRLPEDIFGQVFTPESTLSYQSYQLKKGQQFNLNGYQIIFEGFDTQPSHPNYIFEEGDLPVGAQLKVQTPEGKQLTAHPLFFIRDNPPL